MKIGAQLYTLRDFCRTTDEFAETLKKVADIGYTTVQVSGTCPFDAAWLDGELKKNGLICAITHTKTDRIKDETDDVIREHKVFGCRYIGIGYFPNGADGLKDIDRFIEDFRPAAEKIRDAGAYLMYHNHQFEFSRTPEGGSYFDKLLGAFGPDLLGVTLDAYWAQFAGKDPASLLRSLKGRVPCVHLKDMAVVGLEQRMAAIGQGNMDYEKIIAAAEDAGSEYLLVEQDFTYGEDPFNELKKSYAYLRSLGLQ